MNAFLARPRTALALVLLGLLGGCGSLLTADKVNYKTEGAAKIVPLDVPPDLTQLMRDTRYVVPGAPVTASGMSQRGTSTSATTAANPINDVRMVRSGSQRWLSVNRPADAVWPQVKSFWTNNGFEYTLEQQELGLLETQWAENRAKIPQDLIRRTIGKVLDLLYSTGERDKYRTRLERNAAGGVDIFVTHRGMREEFEDAAKNRTIWIPRPNDPELEAEFLSRLMVMLGASAEQTKASLTAAATPAPEKATLLANATTLRVADTFDIAWRRVGLGLDRTGFTVEDRDRAQGLYFVRYVDTSDKDDKGFFGKLFSATKPDAGSVKYRIALTSVGDQTEVRVQNDTGAPDTSPVAARILTLLAEDLR